MVGRDPVMLNAGAAVHPVYPVILSNSLTDGTADGRRLGTP